mgnify:CR=1 FL=1
MALWVLGVLDACNAHSTGARLVHQGDWFLEVLEKHSTSSGKA